MIELLEAEELEALWNEARHLAEKAGDEAELWRFRIAYLEQLLSKAYLRGTISEVEQREGLETCQAAATFFEKQEDWTALDETLGQWAAFCLSIGEHTNAIAVGQ